MSSGRRRRSGASSRSSSVKLYSPHGSSNQYTSVPVSSVGGGKNSDEKLPRSGRHSRSQSVSRAAAPPAPPLIYTGLAPEAPEQQFAVGDNSSSTTTKRRWLVFVGYFLLGLLVVAVAVGAFLLGQQSVSAPANPTSHLPPAPAPTPGQQPPLQPTPVLPPSLSPSSTSPPVTSSNPIQFCSVSGSLAGEFPASAAFDGDLTTYWALQGVDGAEYLTFDACEGAAVQFASVSIAFLRGDQRSASFDLLASDEDPATDQWASRAAVILSGASSSGGSLALQSFPFPQPTGFRFFRLIGRGNSASLWNSYTEIEFHTFSGQVWNRSDRYAVDGQSGTMAPSPAEPPEPTGPPTMCLAAPELVVPIPDVAMTIGQTLTRAMFLGSYFSDFRLLRSVSFEQADDWNGWSNPAGVSFPFADFGRNVRDGQYRCTAVNQARLPQRSEATVFAGDYSGRMVPVADGAVKGRSDCEGVSDSQDGVSRLQTWDGSTDHWFGFAWWEPSSSIGPVSWYEELIQQFHNNQPGPSGWGPQINPQASLYRANSTHYRYLVRTSFTGGRREMTAGYVPVRLRQWNRIVLRSRFHNDLAYGAENSAPPGGWKGAIEGWSADGEDLTQALVKRFSLTGKRIGYVYDKPSNGPTNHVTVYHGNLDSSRVAFTDNIVMTDSVGAGPDDVDPANFAGRRRAPSAQRLARLSLQVAGLPPGLQLDPATSEIKGAATQTGTYQVSVTASCEKGSVSEQFTITVS